MNRAELQQRIQASPAWEFACPSFVTQAAEGAVEVHFQPNEAIFVAGESCVLQNTTFFILLEGRVIVEDELGVPIGIHKPGQLFGIGGALDIIEQRCVTIRCANDGPCVCGQLSGKMLELALQSAPGFREPLEELYHSRQSKYSKFLEARHVWIRETVIPVLSGTPLLAGCPEDIVFEIARPLCETVYSRGQMISVAGESADSMLVLIEGEADVLTRSDEVIGHFRAGASFGDIAALGLFATRTLSVRATRKCRILAVTQEVLQRVELVRANFDFLLEDRQEQIKHGLPLTALPLNLQAEDMGVCAVSMTAEHLIFAPGEIWEPAGYSDPCGPHYAVLTQGHAQLVMSGERFVTNLAPGALVPEGLLFEFGTKLHPLSKCEIYRFLEVDLLAVVNSVAAAKEWLYNFRLFEADTTKRLAARLRSVQGAEKISAAHPTDDNIHEWRIRREKAIERARIIKKKQAAGKLPQVPQFRAPTLDDHRLMYVKYENRRSASAKAMSKVSSAPQLSKLPRLCEDSTTPLQTDLPEWAS